MVVKAEVNKAIRLSDGERPQSLPFLLSEKAGETTTRNDDDDGDGWWNTKRNDDFPWDFMTFLIGFIDLSEISMGFSKVGWIHWMNYDLWYIELVAMV